MNSPKLLRFYRYQTVLNRFFCGLMLTMSLAGCETTNKAWESLGGFKDKTLEVVGFKKPDVAMPDVALPAWRIPLVLNASSSLNIDSQGRSLSLLIRLYRLKSAEAFLSAPYQAFGTLETEKQRLGEDLIEVREIQLVPGQIVDTLEKVGREANYLGIVALFRSPAGAHWKYAFRVEQAQLTGLSLSAHACAMSITKGQPYGTPKEVLGGTHLGACPK